MPKYHPAILLLRRNSDLWCYCLSNAMHSIGQSIKSPECPCVRACVQLFWSYLSSTFPFPSPSAFPCPFHFSFSFPFPFPFFFPFRFSVSLPSPPSSLPLSPFSFLLLYLPCLLPLPLSLLPSCPRPCIQYVHYGPPIRSRPPGVKWSRDRWRHVTPKSQVRDPIIIEAPYLHS